MQRMGEGAELARIIEGCQSGDAESFALILWQGINDEYTVGTGIDAGSFTFAAVSIDDGHEQPRRREAASRVG